MKLNREQLIESVKAQMPAKRWTHTEGVMITAVQLAERFGADPAKAELAAILHDVAKYWPIEKMERIMREHSVALELLDHDKPLWHAPVGAYVAETEYEVTDEEVLDAIRYHTSGREEMTLLDKIVCLADYIEPGRDFPGVEHIRERAEHDLDAALMAGFDSTITFLILQQKSIYPLTVMARNSLVKQK
ncbi:bis(5'-nucleosyl)-tetraphosphatase (symmetrical) YqeK [Paenibacillus sp. 481]|uniref:bis(5'-nucleosyl)-tetraphosphatase (symmetrical) YqeK n=1 Tax=Paenibacillus sp. 481 TaxID=2835869 RepID=UPI001E3A056C|nr:bis(5'-nucleosyl)-tetraphosphatase (symmetrical) YqeK [Paenibacillus sp. 481]UHA74226.1 bis(5'-nucleosyl)-tetraphosphatase (symmetrical) YqeK [Paenibacillus sp. 481]